MAASDFDKWLHNRATEVFEETRAIMPQECILSGKVILPFQKAWRKKFYYHYSNKVAFTQWICQEEMLFSKLKGRKL